MNDRIRTILALGLAVLAALLTYQFMAGVRENTEVIVAVTEIPAGTAIEESMLRHLVVSKREQELLTPQAVKSTSQVIGQIPKQPIHKGTVLTLNPDVFRLSPELTQEVFSGSAPPSYLIPAGFVAIAIPVEADTSVGYTLRKGDVVNVIWTGNVNKELEARTILMKVQIFDVGQQSGGGINVGGDRGYRTVTLLVTPQDAQKLAFHKRSGKIDLALVGR